MYAHVSRASPCALIASRGGFRVEEYIVERGGRARSLRSDSTKSELCEAWQAATGLDLHRKRCRDAMGPKLAVPRSAAVASSSSGGIASSKSAVFEASATYFLATPPSDFGPSLPTLNRPDEGPL